MNLSLSRLPLPLSQVAQRHAKSWLEEEEDSARLKRLRALVSLFALYATALLAVILISDGADIGCILAGIAGHVLYASGKTALAWREASWLERARARVAKRMAQRPYRFALNVAREDAR